MKLESLGNSPSLQKIICWHVRVTILPIFFQSYSKNVLQILFDALVFLNNCQLWKLPIISHLPLSPQVVVLLLLFDSEKEVVTPVISSTIQLVVTPDFNKFPLNVVQIFSLLLLLI